MKEICYIYEGSCGKLRNSDPKHLTIHQNRSFKSTFCVVFNGASVLKTCSRRGKRPQVQADGISCAVIFILEIRRRAGRGLGSRRVTLDPDVRHPRSHLSQGTNGSSAAVWGNWGFKPQSSDEKRFMARISGKRVFTKLHTVDSIPDAPLTLFFLETEAVNAVRRTGGQSWQPDQTRPGFSLNILPIPR